MRCLKKLKSILLCNKIISLVLIFTLMYVYVICNLNVNIDVNNTEFNGIVEDIKSDTNKIQIYIKGKELLLANKYNFDDKFIDSIKIGYKVKVLGKVNIPNNNTNFNTFNYKNYLLSKKIKFTVTIDKLEIIDTKQTVLYIIKDTLKNYLLENKEYPYLNAFILGDTSYLNESVKDSYLKNGISHLFSVSGMHIGFLSSIILILLNKINKNKNLNHVILFAFLIFYAFDMSISNI